MELRQNLANSFGLQLPVTLLYDYQTVADIVGFVAGELETLAATASAATGRSLCQLPLSPSHHMRRFAPVGLLLLFLPFSSSIACFVSCLLLRSVRLVV